MRRDRDRLQRGVFREKTEGGIEKRPRQQGDGRNGNCRQHRGEQLLFRAFPGGTGAIGDFPARVRRTADGMPGIVEACADFSEKRSDFLPVARPFFRIFFQHRHDEPGEFRIYIRLDLGQRRRRQPEMGLDQRIGISPERRSACRKFIKHHAETVDVAGLPGLSEIAADHLRCGVEWGDHDFIASLCSADASKSEIGQFQKPVSLANEQIARLDVAVYHLAVSPGVGERIGELDGDIQQKAKRQFSRTANPDLFQSFPGDILHCEEVVSFGGGTRVERLDDVWVVEPCGKSGFPQDVPDVIRFGRQFRQQEFQRDFAVERQLPGQIDDAVVAATEFGENPEPGDIPAGEVFKGRGGHGVFTSGGAGRHRVGIRPFRFPGGGKDVGYGSWLSSAVRVIRSN